MQRLSLFCGLLVLWLIGSVLASPLKGSQDTPDIRERLLASFQRSDKDLKPEACLLTHFSYLGKLTTARGRMFVCDTRWVLQGMQAPRGFNYIVFFDARMREAGKIRYIANRPLWCAGSKVYLYGDLDNSAFEYGNVIDVTKGFSGRRIYHQKVYGSSGGIRDN